MKRYNVLLSILLSFTTVLLIISIFLFNGRFVKKVLFKNNIVDIVYNEIDKDIDDLQNSVFYGGNIVIIIFIK